MFGSKGTRVGVCSQLSMREVGLRSSRSDCVAVSVMGIYASLEMG